MIPRRKSKDFSKSGATANANKNKKQTKVNANTNTTRNKAIVILIVALSVSTIAGIGFAGIFVHGYSSTADSTKNSLCTTKVLDMSQRGIIRDAGGFSGAVYECIHMASHNSIYNDALSTQ